MAKKKTKKSKAPRRKTASKRKTAKAPKPAGSVIEKTYKGKTIKVTVTDEGFRYGGKDWKSLTALAIHITGYKAVSGPRFFGLAGAKAKGGAR